MTNAVIEEKDQTEFDHFAPTYDELVRDPVRDRFSADPLHFHRRKWIVLKKMLARAGASTQSMNWLDVGCGGGELLTLAGGNFAQAHGCDPSAGMLARSPLLNIRVQESLIKLPFADRTLDFVTAVCVYHHVGIADRELLTREIRRVLKPGGLFCMVEHNPLNPVTCKIVKRCPVDSDAVLLTAGEAERIGRRSGFKPVERHYFLYLPEAAFQKAGWVETMLGRIPLGGQYAMLLRAED